MEFVELARLFRNDPQRSYILLALSSFKFFLHQQQQMQRAVDEVVDHHLLEKALQTTTLPVNTHTEPYITSLFSKSVPAIEPISEHYTIDIHGF